MPVILYSTLRMVWSLAQVGTARKSMSSFFIAAFLHLTSTQNYTNSTSHTECYHRLPQAKGAKPEKPVKTHPR